MFVIKRRNGEYVATPASNLDYTKDVEFAIKFESREDAEDEIIFDDEYIVEIP